MPEHSHDPAELDKFQNEFASEIELLSKTDFSRGNATRQRIQRRLEEKWRSLPWWKMLWSGMSDLQARLAIASTALVLFGLLNVGGAFALPQRSSFFTPVPLIPAQIMNVTSNSVVGTQAFGLSTATVTPQVSVRQTVLLPTPIPVPVPFSEY